MKHRYHLGRKLVALMLVLFMFASTAFAAELRVDSPDGLALGAEVFSESEALEGVYVDVGKRHDAVGDDRGLACAAIVHKVVLREPFPKIFLDDLGLALDEKEAGDCRSALGGLSSGLDF